MFNSQHAHQSSSLDPYEKDYWMLSISFVLLVTQRRSRRKDAYQEGFLGRPREGSVVGHPKKPKEDRRLASVWKDLCNRNSQKQRLMLCLGKLRMP